MGGVLFSAFGYDVDYALAATVTYSFLSLVLFIIVCVYGWKRMKMKLEVTEDTVHQSCWRKFLNWFKLVYRMKSIYFSALVHIYDIATDVGIIVDWGSQMIDENKGESRHNVRGLNMTGHFTAAVVAFFLYRFVSAGFVYEFTGKFGRACIQWFDLEIYHAIYITHKLGRDEAGNLQRWLQKFEAIFESAPQSLLQIVYIVKTADYSPQIVSSIILSFFSVAARFTSDDKIFFNTDAEGLGLKWKKRRKKIKKAVVDDDDTAFSPSGGKMKSLAYDTLASAESIPQSDDGELAPTEVRIGKTNYDDEEVIKPQTALVKKPDPKTGAKPEYEVQWSRWKMWNHIGLNRAYLFRYSFRMCDVFSRLMILGLIWCTLTGTVTLCILAFEVFTFVVYAQSIGKYNFFQFLVATYFSEDNRNQTVSYCFFRRMESLIYLVLVSIWILFAEKYNDDSIIQCYSEYCTEDNWDLYGDRLGFNTTALPFPGQSDCANDYTKQARRMCDWATDYDRYNSCDCNLEEEVFVTKMLLIAAWAFGNLSGAVFFGAFHSMRQKFGTNERNIVNVMEKRDWEAFSEMLQFGYRMNRFDNKSKRSALSTFLDRVPSHKFEAEEVDRMIQLGANINDQSIKPEDEKDELEPDKIGDNVLIRYIKVTPCEEIDAEFEDVVKKWSTLGVEGGDYAQDMERIAVNINTPNDHGYTPFKVYWEKMQYQRRYRQRKRRDIEYIKKCHQIEYEYEDDDDEMLKAHYRTQELTEAEELSDMTELWFQTFYINVLKWRELGADMSTLSEDRISPLLAYIQDTAIRDYAHDKDAEDETEYIDMDIVEKLCPVEEPKGKEKEKETEDLDEKEEKYPTKDSVHIEMEERDTNYFKNLTLQIKMKAFATWIQKYEDQSAMFRVRDIAKWHSMGCTDNIRDMNLLSTYLQRCEAVKQNAEDIDTLIECGCGLENETITQYISMKPLPMTNVIDAGFGLKSKVERFDDSLGRWYTKQGLEYYNAKGIGKFMYWAKNRWSSRGSMQQAIAHAEAFFNINHPRRYMWEYAQDGYEFLQSSTKMNKVLDECWTNDLAYGGTPPRPLNLKMLEYILEKYKVKPERTDIEVYDIDSYSTRLQKIIETQADLTVEAIQHFLEMGYLLVHKGADIERMLRRAVGNPELPFAVFEYLINAVIDLKKKEENEEEKEKEKAIELDYKIFEAWIQKNKSITFENIEILIQKYGFSPYLSGSMYKCSVHEIWKNAHVPLQVLHRFWIEYGEPKFGKFPRLYRGFLFQVLESKNLTKISEIEYLEEIFSDEFEEIDKSSGNHVIHYYCKNESVNMEILQYLCTKYPHLLEITNKKDHHALHLLCQNTGLKIEFLRYFVETLEVPMNIKTHAGWQPFEAVHYLMDNESLRWKKKDVKIMIHNLKIDFMTRRAGEFILFRLSHQNNFTVQALIYLYSYYKDKVELNKLKSRKTMYWSKSSGGKTILANLVSRKTGLIPSEMRELVQDVGLDITGKDSDNTSILHFAANKQLTAPMLKLMGKLLRRAQGDQFVVDLPDRSGATPFQRWIAAVDTQIGNAMDVVEVWEDLGADITQSENSSAYNMLHNYLCGPVWNTQLAYIRKLCFDDENPWKPQEKKPKRPGATYQSERKRRKVGKYQIPLHVRPIPDNMTLSRLYAQSAKSANEQINIEMLKYFKSKEEIRFDLDSQSSVLWYYMETTHVNVQVLKFLIQDLKFSIQPQPQDNIALKYMENQFKRDKIDWDVLDYFHKELKVDFTAKQNDFVTILHLYSKNAKRFNCDDFVELIERFQLHDILIEKGSADPTAAGMFYENRRGEIRRDIIQCFKSVGYDIDEPLNNMTPIQNYCELTPNHYIMPSIVQSFIEDGGADIHKLVGRKQENTVSKIIANSDTKIKYDKLATLKMMMNRFGVKLKAPKKRKQGIWYTFMARFHSGYFAWTEFFKQFLALIRIYEGANEEPKHLLHNDEADGKKKIKYKIYLVRDTEYEATLKLKKNKKKLVESKKYLNRIVFVIDDRDSLFRQTKPIDPRSQKDWDQTKIPQKWLIPVRWKEFVQQMDRLERNYENFQKSKQLAETNFFIDLALVHRVKALHSTDEMINDILLQNSNNVLLKYLRSNHESQIFAKDIDEFKTLGVDFKFGYVNSNDALRNYCSNGKNEGRVDESIVRALVRGGCPINWDREENEDDDEKGSKGEVIKTSYTPLHYYGMCADANLSAFKTLVECGCDVKIESSQNFTAVYYLLKCSKLVTPAFVQYLAKECKYNFNQPLSTTNTDERNSDTILFNMYLRSNLNITVETVRALVDIADCDANSRDDINDTNSIKSYIKNENVEKFSMEIIRCLVESGADINEPDNEGVYPIQHLLQISYTPLSHLIAYVRQMMQFGAKLDHILCDDNTAIQDHKLYILQEMKDGYEHYDGCWCTIDAWIWEYNNKKNKIQSAVALDESGSNQTLYISIRRNNLEDISKKMLLKKFPTLKDVKNIMSLEDEDENENVFSEDDEDDDDEDDNDDQKVEEEQPKQEEEEQPVPQQEEEEKEKEEDNNEKQSKDEVSMEMAKLIPK